MNLENIKILVEKWIQWSWEKQLAIFTKNKKNSKYFREALTDSVK